MMKIEHVITSTIRRSSTRMKEEEREREKEANGK